MIMVKLPPIERGENYAWNLQVRNSWSGQKWMRNTGWNPVLESKVWYIMNIYSVLGQLYVEGMMSLEEVAQASPRGG